MQYRPCGNSGLKLPVIGIGCWCFGSAPDSYWGAQDQRDVDEVVNRALDLGCTFFDTAEGYNAGASETALGKALGARRDEAVIASKIRPNNLKPGRIQAECEASLTRLGTDVLDIFMVHWPVDTNDTEGLMPAPDIFADLAKLQQQGKIRHIGISNHGVDQMQEVLATSVDIAVNELAWGPLLRGIEKDIIPFCAENGIGIVGYMALLQGFLCGKFQRGDDIPWQRMRLRHFSGERQGSRHGEVGAEDEFWTAIETIRAIAKREGIPMNRLALAWSFAAESAVTSNIVGCRNIEQLEENVAAAELELSDDLVAEIRSCTQPVTDAIGYSPDYFQGRNDSRIH